MNECRALSAEEWAEFEPVFDKAGYHNPDEVARFVDTRLDKIYDVFLLDEKLVLKKEDRDKEKYDRFFAGCDFMVPPILDRFQMKDACWVTMPYINGTDARSCSCEDAARVGTELAKIQSHYLNCGGNPETGSDVCKRHFERHTQRFWNKVRAYFPAYENVFLFVQERFFSAPRSLVHDDLLPINVLLDGENVWLIDWTYAEILPYFLDLARFAFVTDQKDERYISDEAARAFLDAYYAEMSQNPVFGMDKKEFQRDVAVSAFCQYVMFVFYKDAETAVDSADYQALKKILEYLECEMDSGTARI
ncbi:MAG: phosphotransferase [Lachnospiraceae bacterium]|nr:phosphotransferase [Lachnospiraceae bacterium]